MGHPVRHLLARGIAGTGGVAHRLADFNPAAAGWDRSWCGADSDRGNAVLACSFDGASRLIDGWFNPAAAGHLLKGLTQTGRSNMACKVGNVAST